MTHKPSERSCAERFVKWYNIENGSNYLCCEAEEYLPELNKNKDKKWDYVALQEATSTWIAIEVKQLFPDTSPGRSRNDWQGFCQQISKDIQGRVSGTFGILSPPW